MLCYYHALQLGQAGQVVAVDKLGLLITIAFSRLFFGEKLGRRAAAGLAILTAGIFIMLK